MQVLQEIVANPVHPTKYISFNLNIYVSSLSSYERKKVYNSCVSKERNLLLGNGKFSNPISKFFSVYPAYIINIRTLLR